MRAHLDNTVTPARAWPKTTRFRVQLSYHYIIALLSKWSIISNHWMRLSRIWRILPSYFKSALCCARASVDSSLQDLQNSSYPTKTEFIIHSKYFPVLKGVSPFRFLFFCSPKLTQPRPQVFSVNGSITCRGLHFWRHFDVKFNMTKPLTLFPQHNNVLSKFGQQQPVMVNYACDFNQSETGKYFEWIIMFIMIIATIRFNALFPIRRAPLKSASLQ